MIRRVLLSATLGLAISFSFASQAQWKLETKSRQILPSKVGEKLEAITLKVEQLGEVRLLQRSPDDGDTKPRASLLLLSGYAAGKKSIELMPIHPGVSYIGFDYPELPDVENFDDVLKLIKNIAKIPLQIAATMIWMHRQADLDPRRMVITQVSFGGFVGPLGLRLAQQFGIDPAATIFAYSGADVKSFIPIWLAKHMTAPWHDRAEKTLTEALAGLNTRSHLKRLTGPFLVIRSQTDTVIPYASSQSLWETLPGPKKLVELNTDHINVDQYEAIQLTFIAILEFLREQQIVP